MPDCQRLLSEFCLPCFSGAPVDWWSFGILLHELVYGRSPFRGARREQTFDNIVKRPLAFPDEPSISPACKVCPALVFVHTSHSPRAQAWESGLFSTLVGFGRIEDRCSEAYAKAVLAVGGLQRLERRKQGLACRQGCSNAMWSGV